MLNKFIRILGGDPNKREIDQHIQVVEAINSLEPQYEALSDEALRAKTGELRLRLAQSATLEDVLPEAFAAVREAGKRTLGLRHYDVQLIGGIVLQRGAIAEMRTGEGKTLVATLPLYLNALALNPAWSALAEKKWGNDPQKWEFLPLDGIPVGRGVHLITVNDYLARRDARWMAPLFLSLGMNVGVLQTTASTDYGKNAFLVDLERRVKGNESINLLRLVERSQTYAADIVYGTNSEFGFDYLRDNIAMRLTDRVQRGHHYAIVDEVDNVLIDEARTPLIISSPASENIGWYQRMAQIVGKLNIDDVEVYEKDRSVSLTEIGETHIEELLGMPLRDPERPEDITPEQAHIMGYLEQSLRARYLFHSNKDYLKINNKIIIVDEFTGRQMPGRRWSDGLHQAVEAKEGVPVLAENVTSATITIQNYFRMYEKLAGMTGTAATEAEEFSKIYNLDVVVIPTNLDYIAERPDSDLITVESRDSEGYKYTYYTGRTDTEKKPLLWKRKDYPDIVYRTEDAKLRAIVREILQQHVLGRPLLVGTTSVELSERLSTRLNAEMLSRLALILILRRTWFEKNKRDEMDGFQVAELQFLNEPLDKVQVTEMRKLGRDLSITLNPEEPANLATLAKILNVTDSDPARHNLHLEHLRNDLRGGIPHQVLNARKHTEESQIIAGAGAFGAVTIATNMAGRGVDIKLGGEIDEDVLEDVNVHVLKKAGYKNYYDMSLEARRQALVGMDPSEYGIYENQVRIFINYVEAMKRVKSLGGLHIIGSERHESRRIDNQLRGRAARQGDPGSSRFYLSMQDELMRLFGGEQVDGMMQRLKIDDAMPLEHGLVGRLIEQSQTRVESMHFDARKHVLEYDDVLNTQRANIYSQRNRIFIKDDLSEDVTNILSEEIHHRVPEALSDEEGPWRLLSWLEQIQPNTKGLDNIILPSYSLKILIESCMLTEQTKPKVKEAIIELARHTLDAEEKHINRSLEKLFENIRDHFEQQMNDRLDILYNYLDGVDEWEEDDSPPNIRSLLDELNNTVKLPIKLTLSGQRILQDIANRRLSKSDQAYQNLRDDLQNQITIYLTTMAIKRVLAAVGQRVEDLPKLNIDALPVQDWDNVTQIVQDSVQEVFDQRRQQYFDTTNEKGIIVKEVAEALERLPEENIEKNKMMQILHQIAYGTRTFFHRKTHRRMAQYMVRLYYPYYATQLIEGRTPQELTKDILEHLKKIQSDIQYTWGHDEFQRLKNKSPIQFSERAQRGLFKALGEEIYTSLSSKPLESYSKEQTQLVIMELGRQALTETYRDLLLRVISSEWIEYLTQIEALRVGINLEAQGVIDPLVLYKSKASDLFNGKKDKYQNIPGLKGNIRAGIINIMFTILRPRSGAQVREGEIPLLEGESQPAPEENNPAQAESGEAEEEETPQNTAKDSIQTSQDNRAGRKKRRRH